MDLQIELFSTPTVEGRKILSSKGLVCANVVLGAGVISNAYKEECYLPKYIEKESIEPYHQELFDALEKEVLKKGANAVIDLHIEHSYVHYGDSYYLLISAHGTAVALEGADIPENRNINSKVLEQQIIRKQISTKLKEWYDEYNGNRCCHISNDEWKYICRYPDISYAEYLHLAYTEHILDDSINVGGIRSETIYYSRFFKYFKKLPYEKQIELAYKYCNQQSSKLIVECDLFDAKHILEWAQKGKFEFATECLKAQKKEYSAQDLEDMQELYDFFADIPTDKIKKLARNPDNFGKYRYKCINCDNDFESRDADEYYCPHCKKGKKGLTQEREERVKEFGIKIETLKELLS